MRRTHGRTAAALAAALLLVLVSACASVVAGEDSGAASPASPATAGEIDAPPPGGAFDYQLGGAYAPPTGVTVVVRDRTAAPVGAGYDVCYVNGFQTQPGESDSFADEHTDLLVTVDGSPLADPGWPDEYLFDTSSAEKRSALVAIVGDWITGCAEDGFQAVEIDNLDSYLRSDGVNSASSNLALAAEYARVAHTAGLAIAQKNTAEHTEELRAAGYDFAVTESCMSFEECSAYTDVYPTVLDIEYTDELGVDGFRGACDDPGRPASMILRDPKLVDPADPDYHYETCGG
ncbi:endo alpha-1,4 polygalactosaminidase [Microbacterium sp. 2C]|uniref:endo alpha-1,4 polygalactosaminidase n=1 Tax=Microbacterium paulum TaxID=2707006 RepID=UPI0018C2323D|nr:endo alpha-1,4 polygalactosaminidase [Microbacterium paulum]MBG0716972.1 endo alpha-1,4 polygalactosaminidase [Microbacterium paulum]